MEQIELLIDSIHIEKMSDEEYFSTDYKHYASNSSLSLLDPSSGGSIEKFLSGYKEEYSSSFELGSAVHCCTLQKDEYIVSNIQKPGGKLGLFAEKVYIYRRNNNIKLLDAIELASKDTNYYYTKLSSSRLKSAISKSLKFYLQKLHELNTFDKSTIYLSESIYPKFISIINNLESSYACKNLLTPTTYFESVDTYNEYAIFCDFKITLNSGEEVIIPFKGKLDNFTINYETNVVTLNDLKTTGKFGKYFMGNNVFLEGSKSATWIDGSFQKYHYYRQMAIYLYLLQAISTHIYKLNNFKFKTNMLVVETCPNYNIYVYPVNKKYINYGLEEFKKLMLILAEWKIKN